MEREEKAKGTRKRGEHKLSQSYDDWSHWTMMEFRVQTTDDGRHNNDHRQSYGDDKANHSAIARRWWIGLVASSWRSLEGMRAKGTGRSIPGTSNYPDIPQTCPSFAECQCWAPRKLSMCFVSWERMQKSDPHNLCGWIWSRTKGAPMSIFGNRKFRLCAFQLPFSFCRLRTFQVPSSSSRRALLSS